MNMRTIYSLGLKFFGFSDELNKPAIFFSTTKNRKISNTTGINEFHSQKIHETSSWFGRVVVCFLSVWGHQAQASQADLTNLNFKASETKKVSDSTFPHKKTGKTYSWFFDSIVTKQEMALVPTYFKSRIYGSKNWGFRFFTFSPDKTGYYGSFSVLNQFLKPYLKLQSLYRKDYAGDRKTYFTAEYSNYFHPWYGDGGKGIKRIVSQGKEEKNRPDLYAHRIFINQKILFKKYDPFFYGAGVSWIFRKENLKKQKRRYFEDENFLFPKVTAIYDSRDSWENTKKGQYHQVSFGCALRANGTCLLEGDFRFYFPIHNKASLAFRGFTGRALFNELTYSLAYRLGGSKVLRGFAYNRFRGDNVYFAQSELRMDFWKEILSGVLFFELGEVSSRGERFLGPRWDYGLGLRFGIPPSYKMKIRVDLGFPDKEIYNITVDFRQSF